MTTDSKITMVGHDPLPANLWEQMSPDAKAVLVALLGFDVDRDQVSGHGSIHLRGFKLVMQGLPVLPAGFTVGDALQAYFDALRKRFPDHRPRAEPPEPGRLIGWVEGVPEGTRLGVYAPTMISVYPSETQATGCSAPGSGPAIAVYVRD